MKEELFRKKSLNKVKSPENLEDYIRVSRPSIWMLLISILILLIGTVVWFIFGNIDSTKPTTIYIDNDQSVCYIAPEDIYEIRTGMVVKFDKYQAVIDHIGENKEQGYQCNLTINENLAEGYYKGKVVVKTLKPIQFILN